MSLYSCVSLILIIWFPFDTSASRNVSKWLDSAWPHPIALRRSRQRQSPGNEKHHFLKRKADDNLWPHVTIICDLIDLGQYFRVDWFHPDPTPACGYPSCLVWRVVGTIASMQRWDIKHEWKHTKHIKMCSRHPSDGLSTSERFGFSNALLRFFFRLAVVVSECVLMTFGQPNFPAFKGSNALWALNNRTPAFFSTAREHSLGFSWSADRRKHCAGVSPRV